MKELRIIKVDKDDGQGVEPEVKFSGVKLKNSFQFHVFTEECGEGAQVLKLEIFDEGTFSKILEFDDTINGERFVGSCAFNAVDLVDQQVFDMNKTLAQVVYDSVLTHAGETSIEFIAQSDPALMTVDEVEIFIKVHNFCTKLEITKEEAEEFLEFTEDDSTGGERVDVDFKRGQRIYPESQKVIRETMKDCMKKEGIKLVKNKSE